MHTDSTQGSARLVDTALTRVTNTRLGPRRPFKPIARAPSLAPARPPRSGFNLHKLFKTVARTRARGPSRWRLAIIPGPNELNETVTLTSSRSLRRPTELSAFADSPHMCLIIWTWTCLLSLVFLEILFAQLFDELLTYIPSAVYVFILLLLTTLYS